MSDAAGPVDPDSAEFVYDEFSMFHENCAEYDLPFDGPPTSSLEQPVSATSAAPSEQEINVRSTMALLLAPLSPAGSASRCRSDESTERAAAPKLYA